VLLLPFSSTVAQVGEMWWISRHGGLSKNRPPCLRRSKRLFHSVLVYLESRDIMTGDRSKQFQSRFYSLSKPLETHKGTGLS